MNHHYRPTPPRYFATALRGAALSADPEEAWQRRQDLELLGSCLEKLRPTERFLISRHYLEEEPLERARRELGLTRSEARTSVDRALKRMKKLLREGACRPLGHA